VSLEHVSEICSGLPEATRELSGRHAVFKVRGKTFAYYLDDHHGDGMVGVVFKTPANEGLIAANPDRFYMPAYIGHRGWAGLRLDVGPIDWTEVSDFVTDSYLAIAPKRLAAQLE
jgi:hypothetical protein